MTAAIALAAVSAALAVPALSLAVRSCLTASGRFAEPAARRLTRWSGRTLRPFADVRASGRLPSDTERVRFQAVAGGVGLLLGTTVAGPRAGVIAALSLPWLAGRMLEWHRGRYRRKLEDGAAGAALAISDALLVGRSIRNAIAVAGESLDGPIGVELRVLGRQLALGEDTGPALERFRNRAGSRRVDLIVAAIRLQRRSGGSLASLLRQIAETLAERDRLDADVRATTAQARFTSNVVLCLPLVGLLLAELAAPGLLRQMTESPVSAFLLAGALALQLSGAVLVRRLTKTDHW